METQLMTAERVELRSIADRVEIAPGVHMPRLGLGTWNTTSGREIDTEISTGLQLGYRGIDTSPNYYNELQIGRVLASSGVPREELWVQTKVEGVDQGLRSTLEAFEGSRRRLGLDYIDLYLIHWPRPGHTADTWRAFERLLAEGKVRAIGVCNFEPEDFGELFGVAEVPPAVNQFELNPVVQRPELESYCREHGITVQAWAPVIRGKADRVPQLAWLAERHNKTPSQIAIRWLLQKGHTTIPKSVHRERLRENADVFDFELTLDEMSAIREIHSTAPRYANRF